MDNKLLYITGAGASYYRVPVVADLRQSLEKFVFVLDWLKKIIESGRSTKSRDSSGPIENEMGLLNDFLSKARLLSRNANNHATIDTYAKKLFFQKNETELYDLKVIFGVFLLYLQAQRVRYSNDPTFEYGIKTDVTEIVDEDFTFDTPVDERYDTWFASLMKSKEFQIGAIPTKFPAIPENIKMLSWNYDIQLERAYFGFVGDQRIVGGHIRDKNQFLQINGSCLFEGLLRVEHSEILNKVFSCGDFRTYDALRLYGLLNSKAIIPGIRFAWDSETKDRLKMLTPFTESNILVIVGYSFPYFNRETDIEIFSQLPNLERIYIQGLEKDLDGINKRLGSILNLRSDGTGRGMQTIKSVVWVKDLNSFFIPDEF